MRIVLIASGDFAIPTLRSLTDSTYDTGLVITQPDRPTGRGKRLTPTPVKREALGLGLSVVEAENINDAELIERVRGCNATVGLVIAFGQKIGPAFRAAMPGECINLHASLLPKYRGAAPFQWAVIQGESITGITVFRLVDRMDAGPVLTTRQTKIGETETAEELHDRLADLGREAVFEALDLFAGGQVPAGTPQDESLATRAPKFKKADGWIEFDQPARVLARRINGLWSWPGAVCRFVSADGRRDERVTLARAKASTEPLGGEPGRLNNRLEVATTEGALQVLEIKPEGGKRMEWQAFVNGRHVKPGDRFVAIKG